MWVLLLLFLVQGVILGGVKLEDGFYKRLGGAEDKLGERVKFDISKCAVDSRNNSNTKFSVCVTVPYDRDLGTESFALVIDGVKFLQNGSGESGNHSEIWFYLEGKKHIKKIEDYLGVEATLRKHPGHQILVTFETDKKAYDVGDKVVVKMRVKNVGLEKIVFRDGNQFQFAARLNGVGVAGKKNRNYGSCFTLEVISELKPNQILEKEVELNEWFAFEEEGIYRIHGAYSMELYEAGRFCVRTFSCGSERAETGVGKGYRVVGIVSRIRALLGMRRTFSPLGVFVGVTRGVARGRV